MDRYLIDYLPDVIKDTREYKAILNDGEQPEIETLWQAIEDALNDQFIPDATENGVKRWEEILKITPKATYTLDERKFAILAKINEQTPYTMRALEDMLKALCGENGYKIQLNANEYTLIVKIDLIAKNKFKDAEDLLKRVIPANLNTQVYLIYTTHEFLHGWKHEELKAYTHYQLRNEVLNNGN